MKISTHKLIRISLVNWYLFAREDIEINGDSILLTGGNGSGKSSILDAIQAVMAGGDENKLSFNAASSEGTGSGRTLRSYALGEVAEDNGSPECESRAVSNTYLALVYQKPSGEFYSLGCAFHARRDRHHMDKGLFLVEGYDLSSADFMADEYSVLPFKDFQTRLAVVPGKSTICSTALDFRNQCSQLMSRSGAHSAISAEVLFRTITQGLRFRPQKNVTEFIRNHILPARDIDVLRIENDYKQYLNILKDMKDTKDRLERLQLIIKRLHSYKSHSIRSVAYDWAAREAMVSKADLELEDANEKREMLNEELEALQLMLEDLEGELNVLRDIRDRALLALKSSDVAGEIGRLNDVLTSTKSTLVQIHAEFDTCRKEIVAIERLGENPLLTRGDEPLIRQAIESIQVCTDFKSDGLLGAWPRSAANLQETFNALAVLEKSIGTLTTKVKGLLSQDEEFDARLTELVGIHKDLQAGKASLKPQTQEVIRLLEKHSLKAVPICDLAEISDAEWQEGVERFLGVWNREALLIIGSNGEPASGHNLDRALAIYRREKNSNKLLRAVKILNPEKIHQPKARPRDKTAAALIISDNLVARHYLQNILNEVELVYTEEDLRKCRRGITKDGMTAANGTISGGNAIEFVLLGAVARKDQAEKLQRQISLEIEKQSELRDILRPMQALEKDLTSHSNALADRFDTLLPMLNTANTLEQEVIVVEKQIVNLESNDALSSLQNAYDEANNSLTQCENKKTLKLPRLGEINTQIKSIDSNIPVLQDQIKRAAEQRTTITKDPFFDVISSSERFGELCEKHSDDYDEITTNAFRLMKSHAQSANSAKEAYTGNLTELFYYHDFEDKAELLAMAPVSLLARCEQYAQSIESSAIAIHQRDAEQTCEMMIQHFRHEVASKLRDNMLSLNDTFDTLNRSLKDLHFNNTKFKFTHHLVKIDTFVEVHKYVTLPDDQHDAGSLFDESQSHPGLKVIEDVITSGRLHEIADYRNFFSFDIQTTDGKTGTNRLFSHLLSLGSGGEQQSPFYVALGASFMNAYKLQKIGDEGVIGGAALAIFDEAMSKMDGVNTAAALQFFQSLGLQIILAAPPEAYLKIDGYVDRTLTVIRYGSVVFLDGHRHSDKGKSLLDSDNPAIHPELTEKYLASVEKEFEDQ